MLTKPSLLKVPDASYSYGNYNDPACGYYNGYYGFSCSPHGSNCIDATYNPPPPPDEGCTDLFTGVVVTVVGGVIGGIFTT